MKEIIDMNKYDSPALSFSHLDLEGLVCASDLELQVDRWDSIDGGVIDFDDDAIVLG